MKGKTCVITGATSGIGRAAALALGALGANLILLGRNIRAGEAVMERLSRMRGGGTMDFIPIDLSNLNDVHRVSVRLVSTFESLDVLINNAGARFDRYGESADGLELTFATNHLGHFLLTQLLMKALQRSGEGRVITVSSRAHHGAKIDGRWLLPEDSYDRKQAYAKAKLANILFAFELARRMEGKNVTSNAVDPGVVATRFARNNGWLAWGKHVLPHLLRRELTSKRSAGESIAYLASSPDLAGVSGRLFCGKEAILSSPEARDQEAAAHLWEESLRWTR